MHNEKTLSESVIYEGKIFTVKERISQLENGNTAKRELVFHNGGASVLPMDEEGNIYLIRQFRAPFNCETLEIPAGKLEKGEDPFEAAKRELREETGFTAKNYIDLGDFWPTVGFCNEKIYIYIATQLQKGDTSFDEDEFISLTKVKFKKAVDMCLDGTIRDGKTIVAILKAKEILQL